MWSFLHDLRYAFRTLAKRPGFALTAILTLSLGIGATTAIFSVAHSTMWRTLPVEDGDRLVSIVTRSSTRRFFGPVSYPDYQEYRELGVFQDLLANLTQLAQITAGPTPERVLITLTTGNYFDLLRLRPGLGRFYSGREGDIGGESVIVLSHDYWQTHFGGDRSVIGSAVTLNDLPVTVLGVTPEDFNGTIGFARTEVYVPLSVWERVRPALRELLEDRGNASWRIIGRLADGVKLNEADAAVRSRAATLEEQFPETNTNLRAMVFPEPLTRLEPAAAAYLPLVVPIFLAMVGLVLVIACANVAGLLLARAADRKREVALRSALGAGRWRIIRQLMTESLLLAAMGGVVGLAIARWATVSLANVRVASDIPLFLDFSIDYNVFLFAVLITIGSGILGGLAPGLQSSRTNLVDSLKEGGRGTSLSRQPLRNVLVTGQVAVSLILLVCTGLFVQSMWNVRQTDPGFAMDGRFMATMWTGLRNYDPEQNRLFYRDLLDAVRALPSVRSAALGSSAPVGFNSEGGGVQLPGEGEGQSHQERNRFVLRNIVTQGYFETMGVKVIQGRAISEADREDTRTVAVVNRRMAELLWPGDSPLGKQFYMDGEIEAPLEVVGVAANGYYSVPGESPQPHFWISFAQDPRTQMTLFVHSASSMEELLPAIRREVAKLDPDMPVFDIRTLRSHYEEGKAAVLFGVPSALVGSFALIGIVLAATGLFGVISYSVTRRTQEIGIRLALGATPGNVLRIVTTRGVLLAVIGVGIGLTVSLFLTRALANILVGIAHNDVLTYLVVAVAMLLIAFLASFLPARLRLARIQPSDALRVE